MLTKLFYLSDKCKSRLYPKLPTELNDNEDELDFKHLPISMFRIFFAQLLA